MPEAPSLLPLLSLPGHSAEASPASWVTVGPVGGALFVMGNFHGPHKGGYQRTESQVPAPSTNLGKQAQQASLPRITQQGQGRAGLQLRPPDP